MVEPEGGTRRGECKSSANKLVSIAKPSSKTKLIIHSIAGEMRADYAIKVMLDWLVVGKKSHAMQCVKF